VRRRQRDAGYFAACCALPAVVAAFAAPAFGAARTTQPGSTLRVEVTLSDKGIRYAMFDVLGSGVVPARSGAVRGEVAIFAVRNTGRKPHDFAVLGRKTPTLRHGGGSVFSVVLLRRGSFPFRSTVDHGDPGFRGVFVVR
jgi:hypothetical protein